jgi:hypothetical protein
MPWHSSSCRGGMVVLGPQRAAISSITLEKTPMPMAETATAPGSRDAMTPPRGQDVGPAALRVPCTRLASSRIAARRSSALVASSPRRRAKPADVPIGSRSGIAGHPWANPTNSSGASSRRDPSQDRLSTILPTTREATRLLDSASSLPQCNQSQTHAHQAVDKIAHLQPLGFRAHTASASAAASSFSASRVLRWR